MNDLIFTIKNNLPIKEVFNYFLDQEKIILWLAKEASITPKKNGKYVLTINNDHILKGCKILEIDENGGKLRFTWKGPKAYDIVMNFPDQLTTIDVIINQKEIRVVHEGWKSSEDWQKAKTWHENLFWPDKLAKLEFLINK